MGILYFTTQKRYTRALQLKSLFAVTCSAVPVIVILLSCPPFFVSCNVLAALQVAIQFPPLRTEVLASSSRGTERLVVEPKALHGQLENLI